VRPARADHCGAGEQQRRATTISAEPHQRVARQPDGLRRRRHVGQDVTAAPRPRQAVEIGEREHDTRGRDGDEHANGHRGRRPLTPQQDVRHDRRAYVRADLGSVNLVYRRSVGQPHASIVLAGR
jgi:hypothetical protein